MRPRLRSVLFACASILCLAGSSPADAQRSAQTQGIRSFLRGMTVSAPRGGQIWGTDAMGASLLELRRLGVEWVAIHPYGRVDATGQVGARFTADADHLHEAVRMADEAGVQLFWKPHLAYWRDFSWRGEIDFGRDEVAWNRFFDSYRTFIVDQARFAEQAGVPLFSVGLEYERTVEREAQWRTVIAAVREVYSGTITYAANWDGIDRVPFWDAVDVIGVQGYFPLSDSARPDRAEVERGWDRVLERLRTVSARHGGKPILFAEIGYNRSPKAAREPWDHRTEDTPGARALRRVLIDVALERLESEPVIVGLFWWKWMPGDRGRTRNFSMRDPEARAAVRTRWGH